MDWRPGYREWPAPPALRGSVSCLWSSVAVGGSGQITLVLPDGCTDVIWERGRGVFVAGPDTGAMSTPLAPGTILAGVRLRPGAGGPVLGLPLSSLLDQRVDAADLGSGLTAGIARRVPGDLSPAAALRRLTVEVGRAAASHPVDPLAVAAARLMDTAGAQAAGAAAELGVSERQLRRRCLDAVGYGPATLRRVLRFRRFLAAVDAGRGADGDLALLAAEAGYSDQPHLTRECLRLAGLPPATLVTARPRAALMAARSGVLS